MTGRNAKGSGSLVSRVDSTVALDGVEFGPTSLAFTRDMSFEEWESVFGWLNRVNGGVLWWLGDCLRYGEHKYGEMYSQALDATDYNYQSLRNARWVSDKFGELSRRRDNLSWSHHLEVASLEPEDADELLDEAEREHWSQKELRKAVRRRQQEKSAGDPGQLPDAAVYLVDPPWEYDIEEVGGSLKSGADQKYATMAVDDIIALLKDGPLGGSGDAILFLWATAPLMPDALRLMTELGFTYRSQAVWDKEDIGMGWWFRGQHELLLVGRRGNASPPPEGMRVSSVFREKRGQYSAKPECVYAWIEQAFAGQVLADVFGRRERPGWVVWGNQVATS